MRDPARKFPRPASRPEKLKIGYFSADFHNHATLSLMMGLFGAHDKDRFEIHTYSYGSVKDGWRRSQLQKLVDHNWEVRNASDAEIVQHARAQGIDIAIDLKGYTQNGRPQLFAHRMAPIQINYVGYPGTLGADYIDYLIADHTIIPDDYKNAYSEKIIYMPHCYQPNDGGREFPENTQTRTELGLPEDGFVFCSFNANYKISPREFDIWMRLLKRSKALFCGCSKEAKMQCTTFERKLGLVVLIQPASSLRASCRRQSICPPQTRRSVPRYFQCERAYDGK